jgi:molecular chaperone DnaJ
MINYYAVLGVGRTATKDEIKVAYKKLAREHHPDKNGGDDTKFKEVSEAYDNLYDDKKRKAYDVKMKFSFDYGRWGQAFGEASTAENFHKTGKPEAPRGTDVSVDVVLTLDDIILGITKSFTYKVMTTCNMCDGSGASTLKSCSICKGHGTVREHKKNLFGDTLEVKSCKRCWGTAVEIDTPCMTCKGEGCISEEETTLVDLPAAAKHGNFIDIIGKGNAGRRGGARGNLRVNMSVNLPDGVIRKGNDLYIDHEITVSEAVLGTTIKVDGPKKMVELKVKPATQSGTLLRVKNGGVLKGFLYVQLKVIIPEVISDEQRELFKRLSEIDKDFSFVDE